MKAMRIVRGGRSAEISAPRQPNAFGVNHPGGVTCGRWRYRGYGFPSVGSNRKKSSSIPGGPSLLPHTCSRTNAAFHQKNGAIGSFECAAALAEMNGLRAGAGERGGVCSYHEAFTPSASTTGKCAR